MIEITTPVGRLVSGHPMVSHPVKDDKTGLPKTRKDNGEPQVQFYCGLAIKKGGETHWNQTEWGVAIYQEAVSSFPNGEHGQGAFSWKIVDGDSQVPNKKMKLPCDNEGWSGHWIIHAQNGFPITCYHRGKYDPQYAIQRKEEIKTGDYCRMVLTINGNGATGTNTPGVYVNPSLFELYQAGVEIITANIPDANATFGAVEGALPAGAAVDVNVPPQTPGVIPPPQTPGVIPPPQTPGVIPPPVVPHTEILTPGIVLPHRILNGQSFAESALITAGYTPEQVSALPFA